MLGFQKSVASPELEQKKNDFPLQPVLLLLQDDGSAQIHPHHAMTITGKSPGTLSSSTLEISDSSLILLTQSAMTRVKQIHMHQLPKQYVLNVFGWHKTPRIKITRNTKVDRHIQCKDSRTYRWQKDNVYLIWRVWRYMYISWMYDPRVKIICIDFLLSTVWSG